jgi:hypothetical protein
MDIKWIICTVKNNQKQAFSEIQQKWSLTANSNGFIGQIGGWNILNLNEACILSFWENKESLDAFMKNIHDKIFSNNRELTPIIL